MKNDRKSPAELLPEGYQYNLSDFALFLSVMKNKTAYESMLSIILDEPELKLTEIRVEEVVLNESGKRGIRLDAWARDSRERQINTEMQNDSDNDDLRKRARFYQGLMDSPVLKSGKETKYRKLPSTLIIFITQEDFFGLDRAMYTFTEQCVEIPGFRLNDGTQKIFLNMSVKTGRPELVSLLQYMKNSTLENPDIQVMDERLLCLDRVFKEVMQSEEWEEVQMNILEIGIEKGREEGLALGKAESVLELLEYLGSVPDSLRDRILQERNLEQLARWHREAARASSVNAFIQKM